MSTPVELGDGFVSRGNDVGEIINSIVGVLKIEVRKGGWGEEIQKGDLKCQAPGV